MDRPGMHVLCDVFGSQPIEHCLGARNQHHEAVARKIGRGVPLHSRSGLLGGGASEGLELWAHPDKPQVHSGFAQRGQRKLRPHSRAKRHVVFHEGHRVVVGVGHSLRTVGRQIDREQSSGEIRQIHRRISALTEIIRGQSHRTLCIEFESPAQKPRQQLRADGEIFARGHSMEGVMQYKVNSGGVVDGMGHRDIPSQRTAGPDPDVGRLHVARPLGADGVLLRPKIAHLGIDLGLDFTDNRVELDKRLARLRDRQPDAKPADPRTIHQKIAPRRILVTQMPLRPGPPIQIHPESGRRRRVPPRFGKIRGGTGAQAELVTLKIILDHTGVTRLAIQGLPGVRRGQPIFTSLQGGEFPQRALGGPLAVTSCQRDVKRLLDLASASFLGLGLAS